jgi:phenylacetate-coenzyme A ligase PaaK-like adenylate-forming protein
MLTPLEPWIARKIGLEEGQALTLSALAHYKLRKLQQTIAYVRRHSPFYRDGLRHLPRPAIGCLSDMSGLPFTTASALREDPLALLCVSRDAIARVVSLPTSGTSGPVKRIFLSDADLRHTIDFFHHGLPLLISPGQRVMICMPGEAAGSIGALLMAALGRMRAVGVVYGLVQDPTAAVREMVEKRINCVIGVPIQVLAMASRTGEAGLPAGAIRSVLLSTDHVADAVERRIRKAWGCEVFHHYGMTELGYGIGVDCCAHQGYHLREADLHVEIIDPDSGKVLPDGCIGEVVFTTLTRRAMPLLRYRTGDLSRILPGPCSCGSCLPRLEKIRGRIGSGVRLKSGAVIHLAQLDDALFAIPQVIDYRPAIRIEQGRECLRVEVHSDPALAHASLPADVEAGLLSLAPIRGAVAAAQLKLEIAVSTHPRPAAGRFEKRGVVDLRSTPTAENANRERSL